MTPSRDIMRQIIATVATAITMTALAGIWHEVIAAAFYREEANASHEGTGTIFVAYLVLAALMAYLYPRFASGAAATERRPWLVGLGFGAVIGVLWVFPHELVGAGAHGDPLAYVFKNAAWHVVEQGLGGVLLATLSSRGRSKVFCSNKVAG